MFEKAAAVDLGTSQISVFVQGRGEVLRESALAAVDRVSGTLAAWGSDAEALLARPSAALTAVRPIRYGVITDGEIAGQLLRRCLKKALGNSLFRPVLLLCIPSRITPVEEKAIREAGMQAGARAVHLLPAPLAAALGAGLDISGPTHVLAADIGAGTCDAAVLALGGICDAVVSRAAGERFDLALQRRLRREQQLLIGAGTAAEARCSAGCVLPPETPLVCAVQGRDAASGFPRRCELDSEQLRVAYQDTAEEIAEALAGLIALCSPAAREEIREGGILLTGGCSQLRGLDRYLAERLSLPVTLAEEPASCVLRGAGSVLPRLTGNRALLRKSAGHT